MIARRDDNEQIIEKVALKISDSFSRCSKTNPFFHSKLPLYFLVLLPHATHLSWKWRLWHCLVQMQ